MAETPATVPDTAHRREDRRMADCLDYPQAVLLLQVHGEADSLAAAWLAWLESQPETVHVPDVMASIMKRLHDSAMEAGPLAGFGRMGIDHQ